MSTGPEVTPNPVEITLYFTERFGISDSVFHGYVFVESPRNIWAVSSVSGVEDFLALKRFEFMGVHILRKINSWLKPTSYGLQQFGRGATRNVADLAKGQLQQLLEDGALEKGFDVEPGYVILSYEGQTLGCGIYKDRTLVHSLPRGRAIALSGSGLY